MLQTTDRRIQAVRQRRLALVVGIFAMTCAVGWAAWVPRQPLPAVLAHATARVSPVRIEIESWQGLTAAVAPEMPVAPPPEPDPQFRLLSILQKGEERRALVQIGQEAPTRIVVGQELQGWRVTAIDALGVQFEKAQRQLRVDISR